jgi:hypothetical protein
MILKGRHELIEGERVLPPTTDYERSKWNLTFTREILATKAPGDVWRDRNGEEIDPMSLERRVRIEEMRVRIEEVDTVEELETIDQGLRLRPPAMVWSR